MSQLSKREEVWLAAYVNLGYTPPDEMIAAEWADKCLKQFDKKFPVQGGICLSPELTEARNTPNAKAWGAQPAKTWGVEVDPIYSNRMKEIAKDITKFLTEKEDEELLEVIGKFSIIALIRMRNTIDCIIDKSNKFALKAEEE